MLQAREIAKFAAGIAANESLGHWWLGTLGREHLPIRLSLMTLGENVNYIAMVAWPIVLAALVYYAWLSKASVGKPTTPMGRAGPLGPAGGPIVTG